MRSKNIFASFLMAALLALSLGGCTAMTGESAGQYVDDSTITASVKSKLAADKVGSLTRIDVVTTDKVVSLNGIVGSSQDKARAEQLAKQVGGVRGVKNNLQVQESNR
jgi:osmotically-inducible protein OsmY